MSSGINSTAIFERLLNDQVVYVVDYDHNVVFASEGAVKLFEELNDTSESPIGTKCFESFRRRDDRCRYCKAAFLFGSETDDSYLLSDMVCKRYDKNGKSYIIHHLFDSRLLDWTGQYSQQIIDASSQAIVVSNLDGEVLEVNPAFEREMGYTEGEVMGKCNMMFYMNPREAKEVTETIKDNDRLENYKTKVKTKDGRVRHIEITAWIADRGGNQVIVRVSKFSEMVEVLKSMIKITGNILAYERPGNLDLIVEETANLLNSKHCAIYLVSDNGEELVLEAAHDPRYMANTKDIAYKLNWDAETDEDFDGIVSMVAVRRCPFEASNWNDFANHPAYKGEIDKKHSVGSHKGDFSEYAMYAIPLILDDEVNGVFRIKCKNDGSEYSDVDKEIFGLMGTYAMIFLKEQRQLKKAVLEHIAHMTRSPIAEAIQSLSLISDEQTLKRMSEFEFTEIIRIIKNAMMQANITTNNLIVWSTGSSRVGRVSMKSIRVKDIISKITRSFEAFTANVKFGFDVKHSDKILLSNTDLIKLEIILQNIIHNSIKYSKPNRPYVEISISGRVSNDGYNIKIRDKGVGMSKSDLANVWREFYKGESSEHDRQKHGSAKGLGIGLASVKKICTETGWRPHLDSSGVGKGTTFVLGIPHEEA